MGFANFTNVVVPYQPPLWERYQHKMQTQLMTKGKTTAACGGKVNAPPVEKPTMFAFCLKPHGLKVPNKGRKRRLLKKFYVAGVHTFERRSNSFAFQDENATYTDCGPNFFPMNNDASDFNNHPKLYKKRSNKIGALMPRSNLHTPSYNQRPGKRNRVQQQEMEFPGWPSQKRHQLGKGNMQLGVQDIDELRVREASGASKHASRIAMFKREKAQRFFSKADRAFHLAVSALMTANAVKASRCHSH